MIELVLYAAGTAGGFSTIAAFAQLKKKRPETDVALTGELELIKEMIDFNQSAPSTVDGLALRKYDPRKPYECNEWSEWPAVRSLQETVQHFYQKNVEASAPFYAELRRRAPASPTTSSEAATTTASIRRFRANRNLLPSDMTSNKVVALEEPWKDKYLWLTTQQLGRILHEATGESPLSRRAIIFLIDATNIAVPSPSSPEDAGFRAMDESEIKVIQALQDYERYQKLCDESLQITDSMMSSANSLLDKVDSILNRLKYE